MKLDLTGRDKAVLVFLFLFAVVSGFAGEVYGWTIEIDSTDFWQALLPALASVYFIYRTRQKWGGHAGRNISVIGAGLLLHATLWGLVAQWHIAGMPPVIGLNSATIFVLLHGTGALAFLLTALGFYGLYRSSESQISE